VVTVLERAVPLENGVGKGKGEAALCEELLGLRRVEADMIREQCWVHVESMVLRERRRGAMLPGERRGLGIDPLRRHARVLRYRYFRGQQAAYLLTLAPSFSSCRNI
jgi:hypothetical protein